MGYPERPLAEIFDKRNELFNSLGEHQKDFY